MKKLFLGLTIFTLVLLPLSAMAYSFILDQTNLSSSTYPPGYLEVTVALQSGGTQAKVSVDSLSAGGYTYLFGQHDLFDFNVDNVAVTVGSINTSNSQSNAVFTTPTGVTFTHNVGTNVSSGGLYDWIGNATDNGFPHALDHLDFVLTRSSGTWANPADVLTIAGITQPAHRPQYIWPALGHMFVWDGTSTTATTTGFAYGQTVVPIPGSLVLLGSGLVGLLGFRRKL
jgi:hypothetical protein